MDAVVCSIYNRNIQTFIPFWRIPELFLYKKLGKQILNLKKHGKFCPGYLFLIIEVLNGWRYDE